MKGDKKRVSTFSFGEMVGLRQDIQLVGTLENVRDTDKVHDYEQTIWPTLYQRSSRQIHKFLIKITNFIFFVDRPSLFYLVSRA
jgi:hypothetical protein